MPELSSTGARSRLRVSVCAPHCLHPAPPPLPQVTPSPEINLIKPGKIVVTNYCCWRRARWYCLTHVWAPAHTCIVSSYGKCKRYSTYSWRFTDKVTIDIQHPLLGRR